MNLADQSEHFIICGWKKAMNTILSEIIRNNPKLNLKKILIIANIEPDNIEVFHQQYPEYQDITILRGEHYSEALLQKANVKNASKVLILADESGSSSVTETDAQTVMTAMAIKSISININVCAELLDIKFEKYLITAHVDDIIYTNEYNKVLIANSFTKVGIAKVVNDLLDTNTPSRISTTDIPESFIGKEFSVLSSHFKTKHNAILIGLIENVGSYLERKTEAIREAQKTADITKLIDNLQTAKKLENNLPNINPRDSYLIPIHSLAVIIEKKDEVWN